MHIRKLIFAGFCAVLGFATGAHAEGKVEKTYLFGPKKQVEETTKKPVKGKKMTAAERRKLEAAERKQAREQAKVADEKKRRQAERKENAQRGLTAERLRAQQAASVGADVVVRTGNNGELRSEVSRAPRSNAGFFQILFGDEPAPSNLLPETRALDQVMQDRQQRKNFRVKSDFEPQSVAFGGYPRGTIVIDTDARYLYLVEGAGSARRYAIAVGRDGLQFKGRVTVGDKQEWPRWIPTLDMQKREPRKYGQYKDGMPGGPENPLGARAIYLYQGSKDTHLRIHGTNQPQTIGTNSSNGCFRMINDHVIDLYRRVGAGTQVVIL
jgi:lipoprotein-anchoring transpeptidase ErfK/SrfK